MAVGSFDPKESVPVNAIEFDHIVRDVFEKVAVVADYHAGEGGAFQQLFQPFYSGKIEVVGRLVEQKDVGILHQTFDDGESFAPTAGQSCGVRFEINEAGAAESFFRAK